MNRSNTFRLNDELGVGTWRQATHSGAARDWPPAGSLRRAGQHWRDLVEWDVEHVVQHEGQPLGGTKRVEHDLQGQSGRIDQAATT
jgi:hypothetical protein